MVNGAARARRERREQYRLQAGLLHPRWTEEPEGSFVSSFREEKSRLATSIGEERSSTGGDQRIGFFGDDADSSAETSVSTKRLEVDDLFSILMKW